MFQTRQIEMQPGDRLLVFTDGVTEAMNADQELYSAERLQQEVKVINSANPQELIAGIQESLRVFCSGQPQSGGIAIMALFY